MTAYIPFTLMQLYDMNSVNVDQLTETYTTSFYGEYCVHWPEYQRAALHPNGTMMGYVLGKAEGTGEKWHGHVSAVTVAPTFRRIGLGEALMKNLEDVSEHIHNAYFVDLFVRESNAVAIKMYERLGYVVYRRVKGYYSGGGAFPKEEDAFDMRKALSRDTNKSSMVPIGRPVQPNELEWN